MLFCNTIPRTLCLKHARGLLQKKRAHGACDNPCIAACRFSTEEEAVAAANDTEYGLAAYFFTRDVGRAFRVAEALEFGMVGVNETAIVSETAPFGGVKMSGVGRENGSSGILEYVEEKHICLGL